MKVVLALRVKLFLIIFQQGKAESVDAAQRRTQVVRHGVAERLQFLVGRNQFRIRPRQLASLTFELLLDLFPFGDVPGDLSEAAQLTCPVAQWRDYHTVPETTNAVPH